MTPRRAPLAELPPDPGALLTLEMVAKRLHSSKRTVQDLLRAHPFYRKVGRRKLMTEGDFAALIAALPGGEACRSSLSDTAGEASTGTSGARSGVSMYSRLQVLRTELRQKQCSSAGKLKSSTKPPPGGNVVALSRRP